MDDLACRGRGVPFGLGRSTGNANVDKNELRLLDAIMPRTTPRKRTRLTVEAQIALAERILKRLHKSIDAQIEKTRDLDIDKAIALHKAGQNPVIDGKEMMKEARIMIGRKVIIKKRR